MELEDLKNTWKAYDKKLEEAWILNLQSWALNLQVFETLQTQKAKSKLNALIKFKSFALVLGILWALFLGFLVYHSLTFPRIFFAVSAGMIMIFTIIAIVVYIRHIVLIKQIDNSETVIDAQRKLALLQSSTINISRVLWLQMPFYSTFFLTPPMLQQASLGMLAIAITVPLLLTWLSIWLYRNINYKNVNKKWFKILFNNPEWNSVIIAMRFLNKIDEFKKDLKN